MTGTNEALRRRILDELAWDPAVDATHIGVAASAGVATLSGHVGNYAEKLAAEKAVRRVKGVKAIAEELVVRPASKSKTSDDAIAARALKILAWNMHALSDRLEVKVEKGWVTLGGSVDWQFQRTVAETSIHKLGGVVGVTNLITIRPAVLSSDIRAKIEAAFKRNAELDASAIVIEAEDGRVTLSGLVRNWYEKDMAETAAWSAPGVTDVDDRLAIT